MAEPYWGDIPDAYCAALDRARDLLKIFKARPSAGHARSAIRAAVRFRRIQHGPGEHIGEAARAMASGCRRWRRQRALVRAERLKRMPR